MHKDMPIEKVPTRVSIAWQDDKVSRFATLWVREGQYVMALTRPRTKDEGFGVVIEKGATVSVSTEDEDLRAAHGVRLCHDAVCQEVNGTPSHPVTRVKPGRGAITCVTRNTARVKRQRVTAVVVAKAEERATAWLVELGRGPVAPVAEEQQAA